MVNKENLFPLYIMVCVVVGIVLGFLLAISFLENDDEQSENTYLKPENQDSLKYETQDAYVFFKLPNTFENELGGASIAVFYTKESNCICHVSKEGVSGGISCIPYDQLNLTEDSPFYNIKNM